MKVVLARDNAYFESLFVESTGLSNQILSYKVQSDSTILLTSSVPVL